MEERLKRVEESLERLDGKLSDFISSVESAFQLINQNFEIIDRKINTINQKIDNLQGSSTSTIEILESGITEIKDEIQKIAIVTRYEMDYTGLLPNDPGLQRPDLNTKILL